LICEQNTSQEIAKKLFISKRTADGHRDKIFQKANVRNIAGLALYAVRNKMIKLDDDKE
jgi:DNA-binding CsgD family transcriptional regulator